MSKFRRITNYSITVLTTDGKMTGTSWFTSLSKCKAYMKRKLKFMNKETKTIQIHTWREGDTLKTCKRRNIKRL